MIANDCLKKMDKINAQYLKSGLKKGEKRTNSWTINCHCWQFNMMLKVQVLAQKVL